ncbi:MAG: TetR/AcrR family transcriptional regulator [Clostridia bacterium]|nr:TetR/AcrR family transcriptional regulator [Clostridia bacterium]
MKKGELKRSIIVSTAEKLFFERGYEQTSLQDILDALNLSKGGFYHHFASKDALLAEICEQRTANRFERMKPFLMDARILPVEKVNLLLHYLNPIGSDSAAYSGVLLQVCYVDQDLFMRDRMLLSLTAGIAPYMDEAVSLGIASGDFFVRRPGEIGRIILDMAASAFDRACRMLAESPDNYDVLFAAADIMDATREAIETLLGAPYGSVSLYDTEAFARDWRAAAKAMTKEQII